MTVDGSHSTHKVEVHLTWKSIINWEHILVMWSFWHRLLMEIIMDSVSMVSVLHKMGHMLVLAIMEELCLATMTPR